MPALYPLRGMICSRFGTAANFAAQLNWTKQKLSLILTGKREPTLLEIEQMAKELNQPFIVVANIFLASSHRMGNNQKRALS